MRKHAFARLASASLATLLLALGATAARTAHAADVPITEEARTHFAAGVALLQDPKAPRYEEAYREFKAAYQASPSYKILGNLGLSAMKIERDAEAIEAYDRYLKEAGPELTQAERDQIQRDLLTLKAGVVQVTVSSDPPGATVVDVRNPVEGSDIRNAYGPLTQPETLGLHRGHHVITARLHGYQDAQWEFESTPGAPMEPHVFKMVPLAPTAPVQTRMVEERPIPTIAYLTGAITVGLAATGAIVGVAALQKHNDFDSLNDGSHVSEAQSARSSGQTLNTLTDALFGAALVGAVVTGYFVLSRPTIERPGTAATSATGAASAASATSATSIVPRLTAAPTWDARGAAVTGGTAAAQWVF